MKTPVQKSPGVPSGCIQVTRTTGSFGKAPSVAGVPPDSLGTIRVGNFGFDGGLGGGGSARISLVSNPGCFWLYWSYERKNARAPGQSATSLTPAADASSGYVWSLWLIAGST